MTSPWLLDASPESGVGILPEEDKLVVGHKAQDAGGAVTVLAARGTRLCHLAIISLTQSEHTNLKSFLFAC